MEKLLKINDQIAVGPQPAEDELQKLRELGFKSIVNFRTGGEEEQPLSPEDEGEKVRALGLDYLHVPFSMREMQPQQVDRFRQGFANLPKPVFAHCKSGKRAGAFAMMQLACSEGISGDETIQRAEALGFECDKPELKQFVRQYVDEHSAVSK